MSTLFPAKSQLRRVAAAALTVLAVLPLSPSSAQPLPALPDVQAQHRHHVTPVAPPPQAGAERELVRLPAPMREHMLANMRDHLAAIGEIQRALAEGAYDQAARVAEQRLGMTSMASHGAHHMAPLMPKPMQAHGTAMHQAASQFAVEAQNSSASGDLKPALAALARTTAACVGCHAAYRVQ